MTKYLLIFLCFAFSGQVKSQTWQNSGPDGGFFKDFVIHPTNPNIVYAGSDDGGGVWKSTNGGDSWDLLTGDYTNFTGWHIEMDMNHPDTLYFCDIYGRYGILKTTDGGETLEHQTDGFVHNKDLQTTQLVIFPGAGDTLFASTGEGAEFGRIGNGVFSSFNGGTNWNYAGLQGFSVHCIDLSDSERLFAGTDEHGLWYSDDIAGSWMLHPDIPDTAAVLQIDKKDGVLVVSAAANGVYLSLDNGATFSYIGLFGEFNFDLDILSTSPHLEIISTGFFGPNRFTSETLIWAPVAEPLLEDQLLIGVASHEDIIYAGIFSSTQIIKSIDNGLTWEQLDNNPIATEIRAVSVDPESDRIYASLQNSYNLGGNRYNTEALALSTDAGETWTRTGPLAHGMDLEMHPIETETIFLGTFAQGLFKTTDGFDTWEESRAGNKLILDVVIDPDNPDEMILSELDIPLIQTGVFKSIDGGDTWENTGDLAATQIAYNTDNDEVYFSSENGLYISEDNGETISADPVYFAGQVVLSVVYKSPFIYAGTEEGQLYQIDESGTISDISGDWNTAAPTEVRNILFIDNALVIGLNGAEQDTLHNLNGGIWQSDDEGDTWTEITDNLTNNNIFGNTGMAVSNDGQLLIGTYGQGIFRSEGLLLNLLEQSQEISTPEIYPNPASRDVTIQANGHKNINEVSVLTAQGKVVFQNAKLDQSTFILNRHLFDSGLYFIMVKIADEVSITKLIIQ